VKQKKSIDVVIKIEARLFMYRSHIVSSWVPSID
jgi:hypothetical protein